MYKINGCMLRLPEFPYSNLKYMENTRFKKREKEYKREHIGGNIELNIVMNLPKNGVFLDVGGHVGDTSLPISFYAKNNGRDDIKTLIFEPDKKKCEFIESAIRMNKLNAKVYNTCVGDKVRTVGLDPVKHANGSRFKIGRGSTKYVESNENNIKMITLDMIREEIGDVGYIHIDAEGWDDKVIIGGSELIKEKRPIIMCECWGHAGNTVVYMKSVLKKINNNYERMESLKINGKDVNAMNMRANDPIFHISR